MSLSLFLEKNLNERDNGLGDRRLYFGASEILSCEEAMYLAKVAIDGKPKARSLNQLIVLLKGNIGENLVEWGFGKAISFKGQIECEGKGEYNFIKAHADFVVHFPNESVVVEVKTTNDVPDTARESWRAQVQLQLGLLGLKRGKIFAMNLNTGHYSEYDVEFNQLSFEMILKSIKEKWDRIHQPGTVLKGTKSALCGYCQYKLECKTLKSDNVLPVDVEVMALKSKAFKKEIKILDENVKAFMQAAGYERAKGKEVVIDIRTNTSSKRVDINKLKQLYPEIYKQVCYDSSPSDVMNVY